MAFWFFGKRGGKRRDPVDYDPGSDEFAFDEIDATGEFIDDGEEPSRPAPVPAREPLPRPPSPPVRPTPAPPVHPEPSARTEPVPPRVAPAAPPTPNPAPAYDDETIIEPQYRAALARRAAPEPPAASPAAPPPPPPVSPAPTARAPEPTRPDTELPPDFDGQTIIMHGTGSTRCLVAWLVVTGGAGRGRDFRLPPGTARIGSDPACDFRLTGDTYISGHHVEISLRRGQYELRDLNSTNGTVVNGTRVSEAVLHDNDRLCLGETPLVFKSFEF